jgi:hypothetical protein
MREAYATNSVTSTTLFWPSILATFDSGPARHDGRTHIHQGPMFVATGQAIQRRGEPSMDTRRAGLRVSCISGRRRQARGVEGLLQAVESADPPVGSGSFSDAGVRRLNAHCAHIANIRRAAPLFATRGKSGRPRLRTKLKRCVTCPRSSWEGSASSGTARHFEPWKTHCPWALSR